MPIDLQCSGCGERLRVADDSAGKNAKCPKCQAVFPVPAAGAAPSPPFGAEPRRAEPVAAPVTPPAAAPGAQMWQMKTPAGQSYGPVSRQELDSWVAQGRLSADCQVLAVGSDQWQWARDVFPALAAGAGAGVGGASQIQTNPYQSPISTGGRMRHARPHRGGMILAFGIIGLALIPCVIFAPIAWAMGNTDLREMRMGRMDRSGQGSTQAGMICGMIGTILIILVVLVYMLIFCAAVGAG